MYKFQSSQCDGKLKLQFVIIYDYKLYYNFELLH